VVGKILRMENSENKIERRKTSGKDSQKSSYLARVLDRIQSDSGF
jgi:hypothetical protein